MESVLIKSIKARQILDSRGTPTVEVDVITGNGIMGRASVPSGASTGVFEAVELRDNNPKYYFGKSVLQAVKNVNETIAPALINKNVYDQQGIDKLMLELDGTESKSLLGANAILGVSLAVCKAGAISKNESLFTYLSNGKGNILPIPMMNVINGGKHADNNLNIQEFLIMPTGAKTWSKALEMCAETFHALKNVLKKSGFSTGVGDEGGFAPNFKDDEEALKFITKSVETAGYKMGEDFKIALDIASSEMYNEASKLGQKGKYYFWKTKQMFTVEELLNYYDKLIKKYNIISIEDGFAEDDWDSWELMTKKLGKKIQIIGDDLFVTNPTRLAKGIKYKSANAILIKLNQIGTVTETLQTMQLAKENNFNCIISHRSGETEDNYIADFAVATGCGQIKTGAPSRSERVAKYNQLIRIEEELGKKAKFIGGKIFDKYK